MRNVMKSCFAVCALCAVLSPAGARAESVLSNDTSDPMFLQAAEQVLSHSTLSYGDEILRFGQSLSYGVSNRLALGANVFYQLDFDGPEDGFAAIDLGGVYRMMRATDNNYGLVSDVLFGMKFGGSSHVRTPYFADSTYYAGLRLGRQWAGMTLSMTVQSSWVFDDTRGMSYIDFMPNAYFRLNEDWRAGATATIRVSTNDDYNQEWLGAQVVRQYGRTQYIGRLDYEFEQENVYFGLGLNILF